MFSSHTVSNLTADNLEAVTQRLLFITGADALWMRNIIGVTSRNVAIVLVWAGNGGAKAFTPKVWAEIKAELEANGLRKAIVYAEHDLAGGTGYEFRKINCEGAPLNCE